ncbi:MAG TPA: bL28 family ribosomal protein, partial [Candidatus Gracilibacteria bacterium]
FSLKATKRIFRPNLFTKRVLDPQTGRTRKVKLSAKAIRTLKKWAKEALVVAQESAADATPKTPEVDTKTEKPAEMKAPAKKKGPGSKSGK